MHTASASAWPRHAAMVVIAAVGSFLAAAGACGAAGSQRYGPPTVSRDGIEFELAVPRRDAFQRALVAFVHFGLPVVEASETAGTIRTGPYQFGEALATYSAAVSGSDRVARVTLRGVFSAPSLGVERQPIAEAEYGFRADLWRHLSRLARTIETQPLSRPIPDELVRRSGRRRP
jgi:hypothetical protein